MSNYVLVVEDDERQVTIYQRDLAAAGLHGLVTSDLDAATSIVRQYGAAIVAVIVDGAVPGSYLNTIPFIQWMRENDTSNTPMIAASTRKDYRLTMVQYGCTDHAEKRYAVQHVVEQLRQLSRWQ